MAISKKVILVGHFGVGKTSLIRRFVHQKFSDDYLTTIGVKIDKKVLKVDDMEVTLIIWDIAGETNQAKIPKSYQLGAHGILYVFDITRPSTYQNLHEQLDYLKGVLPNAPVKIIANKKDLVSTEKQEEVLSDIDFEGIYTSSAKTGESVEEIFEALAKAMTA
ncbi:MAG: Rab family GTPase [Roseivirga sp.]